MKASEFVNVIGADFYTGVPDSQLKEFCNYLMANYGISSRHIIAANEGNCVGIAAGHYLATGEVPVVYMQNSGIGNIVNPYASLLHSEVYGIPCIFIIGWRGEPGVPDEPQHIFQGKVTETLLKDLEIRYYVVSEETGIEDIVKVMEEFRDSLEMGKSVAFIMKKNAFEQETAVSYQNNNVLCREDAIGIIVDAASDDVVVTTTGKASRELFEIREQNGQSHSHDFLTVGSMGHSSSIALGIALEKRDRKIWCIDGDGAALMHMGSMAVVGSNKPTNMVHIVLNNGAHETVGGMPTVSENINLPMIAKGCGYQKAVQVQNGEELKAALQQAKRSDELFFIEIKCTIASRGDLGRPTTSPLENRTAFMEFLGNG
ncbi:MAG: phosphonopyruvate decarboxylase [Lachnospiraceae bacterium]|jgi:phosphonopyruvate decarboxylase|nr:phosphonopyruvate decarboxylase [Lachnospiraceae bacterium]